MAATPIPAGENSDLLPIIASRRAALTKLCRQFHVHRLELFGSAVRGPFNPGRSDLDFLVEFEAMPPGAYANAFLDFKEALENLFVTPVDLVVPSAVRNPYFRQSVESSRALLYAA